MIKYTNSTTVHDKHRVYQSERRTGYWYSIVSISSINTNMKTKIKAKSTPRQESPADGRATLNSAATS